MSEMSGKEKMLYFLTVKYNGAVETLHQYEHTAQNPVCTKRMRQDAREQCRVYADYADAYQMLLNDLRRGVFDGCFVAVYREPAREPL